MPAMTACGQPAIDPFAGSGLEPAPCGAAGSWGRPLIGLADLTSHPVQGCPLPPESEPLAEQLIVLLSDHVRGHYGADLGACADTRCFDLRRGRAEIDPLLRLDAADWAPGPAGGCAPQFEALALEDVVLGSPSGRLPWQALRLCDEACGGGGGRLRLHGVWGASWPLPEALIGALVLATHAMLRAARQGRRVLVSHEDGQSAIAPGALPREALDMLPANLRRYRGLAL